MIYGHKKYTLILNDLNLDRCKCNSSKSQSADRANYAIRDPLTYWRIALFKVFVDHLVEKITERVLINQERFCAQLLLPTRLDNLNDEQINQIYTSYESDIDSTSDAFAGEVRR
ncbi:hypothetical protein DPMN_046236 [Dreissena polymorpha]|uniref:Uncharacterized protein n=1 Tax=Dreissena polymorpha TaxID=45954 RepID=A0A9D4I0P7_DREPO|nr:hypothetical protein DPMN_046236 [Dreissena polymorpha]